MLAVFGLTGCGQKGPLVLPDAHTSTPVVKPAGSTAPPPNGDVTNGPATGPAQTAPATDPAAADKKKRPD